MNRRTALAAIGTGTASLITGCAEAGLSSDENTVEDRGTPPDDATRVVSVEQVEDFPTDIQLEVSVSTTESWVTNSHPAAIRIGIHNDSMTGYTLLAGDGDRRILSTTASTQRHPGLSLPTATDGDSYPPAARRETPPADGCWTLADAVGFPTKEVRTTRVSAGKTAELHLEVWGHHENEVCFPTGEFDFTQAYTLQAPTEGPQFEWGFTLRVESV